jgi:methylated-DNA-[protein]-cysteine S-methyltransferase
MSDSRQPSGSGAHTLEVMNVHTTIDSPIGRLLLTGETTPHGVVLDSVSIHNGAPVDSAAFGDITTQLRGYFAGELREFDVPHTDRGTPFQQRVWSALADIPYGRTITYGQLAERIGAPRTRIRAVAAAVGANPLLVVRPCHRVIGADGSLTGYAAGVERKRFLLRHEAS